MIPTKARLRWLPPAEGGRHSPPPGPEYSTVARFENLAQRWPQEAWSVVLAISEPADAEGVMVVGIRLLAPKNAPDGLLSSGSTFELYEGKKCVARGEVL